MADIFATTKALGTAGTPQQFDTTIVRVLSITFTAAPANTGTLYVGSSTVDRDSDPPIGQPLIPGQVMTVTPSDFLQDTNLLHSIPMSNFWFDGTVTGDDLVCFAIVE